MKKSTLVVGIISTILILIGVIFRIQHWPGGAHLMVAGTAVFVFGYAILFFIDKSKTAQTGMDKLTNIVVLATMIVIPVGFLFKGNHWPGAGIGILVSHIFLALVVIMLFLQAAKEQDNVKKMYINNSAVILTLMLAISLFIWLRTSAA